MLEGNRGYRVGFAEVNLKNFVSVYGNSLPFSEKVPFGTSDCWTGTLANLTKEPVSWGYIAQVVVALENLNHPAAVPLRWCMEHRRWCAYSLLPLWYTGPKGETLGETTASLPQALFRALKARKLCYISTADAAKEVDDKLSGEAYYANTWQAMADLGQALQATK